MANKNGPPGGNKDAHLDDAIAAAADKLAQEELKGDATPEERKSAAARIGETLRFAVSKGGSLAVAVGTYLAKGYKRLKEMSSRVGVYSGQLRRYAARLDKAVEKAVADYEGGRFIEFAEVIQGPSGGSGPLGGVRTEDVATLEEVMNSSGFESLVQSYARIRERLQAQGLGFEMIMRLPNREQDVDLRRRTLLGKRKVRLDRDLVIIGVIAQAKYFQGGQQPVAAGTPTAFANSGPANPGRTSRRGGTVGSDGLVRY